MREFGQIYDPRDAERSFVFESEVGILARQVIDSHNGDIVAARNAAAEVLAKEVGLKAALTIG